MKDKIVNFRPIFYSFLAFMLGIIVSKRFYGGNLEYILVTLLAIVCISILLILKKKFKPLIILLAFFFIGNGFYYIGASSFNVKSYSGEVAVVGRVSDDIKVYDYATTVVLDNVSINGKKGKNIRLRVTNTYQNSLEAGDKVAFEGLLENSKPFTLNSFNSFDYRSGVRYSASVNYKDLVISEGGKKFDEIVRLDIKNLIYKNMSEVNASIAYAVMFGDKSDLDGEIYTSYQKSGIIHVLTVSGLHVGFLVSLFYGLLRKCGVNNIANLCISTIVILLYAYLCNFSPSVVRAGVMAICMMTARAIHKKYDSLSALGLAGFILCLAKPLTALDIGFLMSFFCVFGIVMLNPPLTKFLSKFLPYKIASLLSISTSAQLGILPFLALMGGSINLLSFAINLIVVPIFGIIYPYMFVVCMLGTFMPFLGVLLKVVDFALAIINKIAIFFGHANITINLSMFGFALVLIFFFILFLFGQYFMIKPLKKFATFTASFLLFVLAFCCYALPVNLNKGASVTYLNYYNDSCVILSSKSGQKLVIGENNLLSRYQDEYKTGDFDVFLSYHSLKDEKVNDLTELGFSKFITCKSIDDEGGGVVQTVEFNKSMAFGDFQFVYISYDDEAIGIFVIFDNQRIFVAKETNLSYNLIKDRVNALNPQIVIAGKESEYAGGGYDYCVTKDEVKGCDCSFSKLGNLQLRLNGKVWTERGLD